MEPVLIELYSRYPRYDGERAWALSFFRDTAGGEWVSVETEDGFLSIFGRNEVKVVES